MLEKPVFLQGLLAFTGAGLDKPVSFEPELTYKVPADRRAQLIYFRGGNPLPELIYLIFRRDGKPMRYFPIGAKASTHVELAVVEDLDPGTALSISIAAPAGVNGPVLLDIGLVEIEA